MTPEITPEMIAAYQRQQAEREQAAMQQLADELKSIAAERGFDIVAVPRIMDDGTLGAMWGVRRKPQ